MHKVITIYILTKIQAIITQHHALIMTNLETFVDNFQYCYFIKLHENLTAQLIENFKNFRIYVPIFCLTILRDYLL